MNHVDIDRRFIKEENDLEIICNLYIRTEEQREDLFTKGLRISIFKNFLGKLEMMNLHCKD